MDTTEFERRLQKYMRLVNEIGAFGSEGAVEQYQEAELAAWGALEEASALLAVSMAVKS